MLLPWFNKYVSTDFHELNIDWLCTAYKDFIEQLRAFDDRLTGIETDVDTRLTAMEGRIDDQDQTIADFKEEVNTRFQELADSIAQQFTDLETEFNGKFDDLEQSINDQFTQLSGDIDERITQFENDITGRLDDFEEAIDARMDAAEDNIIALQDTDKQIKSSMLTQGLLNLYPQEEKTYFPDHSADIVVNMVGGKISAEGTASEDLTVTLAGGPNEIPYGWNTSYDTLFNYRFMRAGVVASQTLTVDVILYVGGVESRRSTFTGGGAITIMEAEMATLSGIEITATAAAGITYNANYIPYIIPMAIGSNISNLQPTTFPELVGRVGSALIKINANNVDADKLQGRNIWMVNMVSNTSDTVDGLTITTGYDGVVLNGTAAADIDYDTSIKLTPDITKIYHILFNTDSGSSAVKFKLHNADDSFVKIYDPATLYEEQFASADQLTLALMIPAGTYDYLNDNYYPSCSTISSNLELMEDVSDLEDRVSDIEDQLMGETTYGPDDILTFTDPVGDVPLKEVIAHIKPVQNLHGYEYPWGPGENKNMIEVTNGSYAAGASLWSGSLTLAAGTYTLSSSNTTAEVAVIGVGSGTMPYTFTLAESTTITGIEAVQAGTFNNVQLEAGSSATSFVPYSNICPISGTDEIDVYRTGKNIADASKFLDVSGWAYDSADNAYYGSVANLQSYYGGGFTHRFIPKAKYGRIALSLKYKSGTSSGGSRYNVSFHYTDGTNSTVWFGNYTDYHYITAISAANKIVDGIYFWYNATATIYLKDFQIEVGTSVTPYERFEGNDWNVQLNTDLYNGTVNLTTGEVIETYGYIASYAGEALPGAWISSIDKYEAGTTPTTGAEVAYELAAPTSDLITPIEIKTYLYNTLWLSYGQAAEVTTQSFIESLVEKFTERFIITYDSVTGTIDRTYNEIFEAYVEGRRLCFYDGNLITELNQFDETNGAFHWEYNEFTANGIDFYEMLIDINGVTVSSKSVTI